MASSTKSDHELVPVQEIMSEKAVKELMQKMKMQPDNLPKILDTDPQAVKLGAKIGQVIRISRKDGKNEYDYYRLVIEG